MDLNETDTTKLEENNLIEETEELVENTVLEEDKIQVHGSPLKPKNKKKRSILSKIINILLWIILLAWMALVITDFILVRKKETPRFCWFHEKTTEYDDGSVKECSGLGYKVINYDRDSFKAIEFGPFWIDDRTKENK